MRRKRNAAGAVSAQFSQAAASFLLSVVGLRVLNPADFGVLGLLLGVLVLATAVMTGFVGDSLTILNRQDDGIRAGLEIWCAVIATTLLVIGSLFAYGAGLLQLADALLFGVALAAFTIEDCARRLLMASIRFWSVVVTDLSYLLVSAATLTVAKLTRGHLVLSDFLFALVVGQVVATLTGIVLLPGREKRFARWTRPAIRAVAGFGAWRALQQSIRPGALTLVRLLVVAAAGRAALGHLEAARVYMSPTLLIAQGAGGFLLATYAVDRHRTRREALRECDRSAILLISLSVIIGLVAVLGLPWLGRLLSGGETQISPLAALGWGFYAAGASAGMSYVSLASIRSPQRTVVGLRLIDTTMSIVLAALVLFSLHASPSIVPFAMGIGILIGAALQRWVALSSAQLIRGSVSASPA